MKLEYLPLGSRECPLVRIYEFNKDEVAVLLALVLDLGTGTREEVQLEQEIDLATIDGCRLALRRAKRDRGLIKANEQNHFLCALTEESWQTVAGLIEPFLQRATNPRYQWLSETGEANLLLSEDGAW